MHMGKFALSVLLVMTVSAAHAQIVTNGSFEAGTFVNNGNNAESLSPGSTAITGWTTFNAELAWIQNGNPYQVSASDGSFLLDLTGYHDSAPFGGVEQTLTTIPGQTYTLAFDLGGNSIYPGIPGITATAGSMSQTFSFVPSTGSQEWKTVGFNFTATSTSTLLSLVGSSGVSFIGLDNVIVTAGAPPSVPEPGSVAMLLVSGIGGAGFLVRRHKK